MKIVRFFFVGLVFLFLANCSTASENQNSVVLNFKHSWHQQLITANELGHIQYYNAHGETLSVERLRYLISNIQLLKDDGTSYSVNPNYFLIDLSQEATLNITLGEDFPVGDYAQLDFVFGFLDEDNIDGVYADLNAANWNVPAALGGGYHYLQLDGKFQIGEESPQNYNYHMIRAADRSDPNNLRLQETAFQVQLGDFEVGENASLTVEMQVHDWFENPYTWDLTQWNTMLMPNFAAQLKMKENGASVFRWPSP